MGGALARPLYGGQHAFGRACHLSPAPTSALWTFHSLAHAALSRAVSHCTIGLLPTVPQWRKPTAQAGVCGQLDRLPVASSFRTPPTPCVQRVFRWVVIATRPRVGVVRAHFGVGQ